MPNIRHSAAEPLQLRVARRSFRFEPQPRYWFEKSWSQKSVKKDQRIERSLNPGSFSYIRIAGSHGRMRSSFDTALQSQALQSFSTGETKKGFDPLRRPCQPKFRRVEIFSFFSGVRHWKKTLK